MKKILFALTVVLSSFSGMVVAQSTLTVKLSGQTYSKLSLGLYTYDKSWANLEGQATNDGSTWVFTYPDSVYERTTMMRLYVPTQLDTVRHIFAFNMLVESKSAKSPSFYAEKNDSITLKYEKQTVSVDDPAYGFLTMIGDHYDLEFSAKEFYIDPYIMHHMFNRALPVAQNIERFSAYVRKNPASYFALSNLAVYLPEIPSREDARKIFSSFSPSLKGTYFWNIVDKYLNHYSFVDLDLLDPKTDTQRAVVAGDKPTLLIFSASWCAPCHKLVPTYKKIYADLGPKMELVYCTIDKEKTIGAWNKFVEKEQIPWRSVATLELGDQLMKQYSVPYIPYALLVMPDRSIDRFELGKPNEQERLYKAIGQE